MERKKVSLEESKLFDIIYLNEKFSEIKSIIETKKLTSIINKKFSNGRSINGWLVRLELCLRNDIFDEELEAFITKQIYDIKMLMYKNNNYNMNEQSDVNYGYALKSVLLRFGYNEKNTFKDLRIPGSVLNEICINQLYPSLSSIKIILNFFNSLKPNCLEQQLILDAAIKVYMELENEVTMKYPDKPVEFVVYELSDLKKYEEMMDVPLNILECVKRDKYDWYVKCVTYNYAMLVSENNIGTNEYFYDGSILSKWIHTQRRILSGKSDMGLNDEQRVMIKKVISKRKGFQTDKKNNFDLNHLLLNNFDACCNAFEDSLNKFGGITEEKVVGNVSLYSLWNYAWNLLKQEEVPLTAEQIRRIKELRKEAIKINKEKNMLGEVKEVNFGYSLACLLDSLNLTIDTFSEMTGCSKPTIATYSRNYSLPRSTTFSKIDKALDECLKNWDLREDQKEDILVFKEDLKAAYLECKERESFNNKALSNEVHGVKHRSNFDMSKFGNNRNMLTDVPKDILEKVETLDNEWYQECLNLAFKLNDKEKILSGEIDNKLNNHKWFRNNSIASFYGQLSKEQEILLTYLTYISEKNYELIKYNKFIVKLESLEKFVYENKRIPRRGELLLLSKDDAFVFYQSLREKNFGTKKVYMYLNDDYLARIKAMIQLETMSRFIITGDHIANTYYFLGVRLNLLRISLGLSYDKLASILGITKPELMNLLRNKKALKERELTILYNLLTGVNRELLRQDQLDDIDDFLNVITNKRIEVHSLLLTNIKEHIGYC